MHGFSAEAEERNTLVCSSTMLEEQDVRDRLTIDLEDTLYPCSSPSSPVVREKREMLERWARQDFLENRPRPKPGNDLVLKRHRWLAEEARRNREGMVNTSEIVVSQDVLEAKKKWKSEDEKIQHQR